MLKLVARQQSGNVTHSSSTAQHGCLTGSRTVCNRAVPYQAHVEIQLVPFLIDLRTVRPDSGKAAKVTVSPRGLTLYRH